MADERKIDVLLTTTHRVASDGSKSVGISYLGVGITEQVVDEIQQLVSAIDEETATISARPRIVRVSNDGSSLVVTASYRDPSSDQADGVWIWRDWREETAVAHLEGFQTAYFLSSRHVLLSHRNSAPIVYDIDTERKHKLPNGKKLCVADNGTWAHVVGGEGAIMGHLEQVDEEVSILNAERINHLFFVHGGEFLVLSTDSGLTTVLSIESMTVVDSIEAIAAARPLTDDTFIAYEKFGGQLRHFGIVVSKQGKLRRISRGQAAPPGAYDIAPMHEMALCILGEVRFIAGTSLYPHKEDPPALPEGAYPIGWLHWSGSKVE